MITIIGVTLAFALGIIWGLYVDYYLLVTLIFLFILMLMLLMNSKFVKLSNYIRYFIILFLIFLIGFFYTSYKLEKFKTTYSESNKYNMKIIITSNNMETQYYNKYYAKNENNHKFIVYFKKSENSLFKIGDTLDIVGEYSLPNLSRNQGTFNYRYYLNSIDIFGTIKVNKYKLISNDTENIIYILQNVISEKFKKLFSQNEAGILKGMLIGDTAGITDEVTENFKNSGITHLLAVSGSNVALVIIIVKTIFSSLFGKRHLNIFAIIFIIFFVFLAGGSPSVMRAGLMAILEMIGEMLIKKSNSFNNLFMSAFIILVINPLSLINVGFILSFAGTIGILIISQKLEKRLEKYIRNKTFLENFCVTLSAQIVLFPIMAYFFNTVSLVSILTNMLVLPVASILTIAGIIVFIISLIYFPLAKLVSIPISYLTKYLIIVAKYCSNISFLNILVPTPSIFIIIIYYLILSILVNDNALNWIKRKINIHKSRLLVYIIVLFLIIFSLKAFPKNYIEIACIDVGQGDSFFIKTLNGKNILIDGGGSETSDYDVGKNILLPYLLKRKITKIDLIFVSHAHADHLDGLITIIENLSVKQIIIGPQNLNDEKIDELYKACKLKNVPIISVSQGDAIMCDGIQFDILYPAKGAREENVNNLSLVIKMRYANKSMLFTGDLESDKEKEIKLDVNADILKVGHHGSKTSSSDEFIKRVNPKIAIVSVAENNNYGHPNTAVLERLKKYAEVYMTKDSGEIRIRIYKNSKIFINECIKNE